MALDIVSKRHIAWDSVALAFFFSTSRVFCMPNADMWTDQLCFRFIIGVNLILQKGLFHCYPLAKIVEKIVTLKSENFV